MLRADPSISDLYVLTVRRQCTQDARARKWWVCDGVCVTVRLRRTSPHPGPLPRRGEARVHQG